MLLFCPGRWGQSYSYSKHCSICCGEGDFKLTRCRALEAEQIVPRLCSRALGDLMGLCHGVVPNPVLCVMSFTVAFFFLLSPKLEVSRVSKRKTFALFRQLCAKTDCKELQKLSVYSEAKEAAVQYQQAKQCFFGALEEMGYGSWICKPQEEDNFSISDA